MNARSNIATVRRIDSAPDSGREPRQPSAQPADLGVRFVALFVDGLILATIQMPISLVFGYLGGVTAGTNTYFIVLAASYLFGIMATVLYYGWFYQNKGATPGKMLFKLKVIDAETGTHLSYGRTFAREIVGKFLSAITFFIGYLMAAFRQDRRALHDLVAKSQVIRRG